MASFYDTLGVSADAEDLVISAAYRALMKRYHPDRDGSPEAQTRARQINAAFEVLSDPVCRDAYDKELNAQRGGGAAHGPSMDEQPPPLDPIVCSKCNNVVAQPRHIVFRQVVSVLITTIRTPVQGVFCSSCAAKASFRATAVSAVAGWWGFPWGPIYTVVETLKNAGGGEHDRDVEQRLLWHNALAFFGRGNTELAYGLARRVQSLGDNELSAYASDLVGELRRHGAPHDSPPLKNPWKPRLATVAPHLAMLCALPALGWLWAATSGNAMTTPTVVSAGVEPASAAAPADGAAPTAPVAAATPAAVTPPPCASTPRSGQILAGKRPAADPGHQLQIQNGGEGPVIVKVRHAETGRLAFSFFIDKGGSATIDDIPDGSYRIQYAIGTGLLQDCKSLSGVQTVNEFPEVDNLTTTYSATQVTTQTLSYTLYSVPDGTVHPRSITPQDFDGA